MSPEDVGVLRETWQAECHADAPSGACCCCYRSQHHQHQMTTEALRAENARLTERLRIAEAALTEIARHAEQPAARTLALGTLNALAAAE